ncbi:helix-hairpin-helix domain-containing protein [Glaciimonas sp. PCH181]|uniref:ComEA family DNA-binding protein n=1 Tax=Glaciimonas sp. PCH181 TaxID=2133943 RepID=UPI000D3B2510|nr:helix-hairpin-helix domain-containing protein [Glaciimonas sp. PCH181]PUA18271.1 hypothetical protein C7W93_14940 [Glaciimonas sp. PCH181]
MLKKLLQITLMLIATMGLVFAQVDVNKADKAALDSVKGVGAVTSERILAERTKGGNFKDWSDFEKRVKGISDKSAVKLSTAGLRVNGQPKSGAAAPAAKEESKKAADKIPAKK